MREKQKERELQSVINIESQSETVAGNLLAVVARR